MSKLLKSVAETNKDAQNVKPNWFYLAINQRKRIVLVKGDSVKLGVELVQVRNYVFLLLQFAALTVWMV